MAKYRLSKRPAASDEMSYYGTYDASKPSELEAMLRATFDFGRWMYHSFEIEPVQEGDHED